MNQFSKLFAVMFLVSSVTAFAGQAEDKAVVDALAKVEEVSNDIDAEKAAAQEALKTAQKAQTAANEADAKTKAEADAKNTYSAKAKAFATNAKAKANSIAFSPILEAKKDGKFYNAAYYLKQGVNKGLRPVVVVAAAFVAYKVYTNRAVEADEADEFDEDEVEVQA